MSGKNDRIINHMDRQPASSLEPQASSQTSNERSVNARLILERVSVLLSHYWTTDEAPELRRLQMADWLADLEVFPASVVALAVTEWRRHNSRRPTPADIRGLCVLSMTPRHAPPRLVPPEEAEPAINLDHEHRKRQWAEAAASRDAWARECGYADFAEGLANGITRTALYPWELRKGKTL